MFIKDRFLLESDAASALYTGHAEKMPIVDFHNHLDPEMIAKDDCFSSLTALWLGGDHYKWRALRANGVAEKEITGGADDLTKFMRWAETVPYTMRNPLYHWTHLELKRYFGVSELLNRESGERIYRHCNAMLQRDDFSVRGLLRKMNVKVLCTTDDPADLLEWHKRIAEDGFEIKVYPTWRPDKVMAVEDPNAYRLYIGRLADAAGKRIVQLQDLFDALEARQEHFARMGCRISDHGLGEFPGGEVDQPALEILFSKLMKGGSLKADEAGIFKSGMLYHLALMNDKKGWAQQFHVGAIRNNNRRLYRCLGPDVGGDSIDDRPVAAAMSRFLGRLDEEGRLTRTVVYNLNPKDADVMMSMICNFNDESAPGKMQYGAAWWFLDQMDGIRRQLEVLSYGGLLSRFVGMLTDSRSFLSFPRHEYFRRILCNLLGDDLEKGYLPAGEEKFIGRMVEDICCHNAINYFKFDQ